MKDATDGRAVSHAGPDAGTAGGSVEQAPGMGARTPEPPALGPPTIGDHEDEQRRARAYGPPMKLDRLHPAVTAADYTIAALGPEAALLLLHVLRVGWMTPGEVAQLEPLAQGIAQLLEVDLPPYRRTT
jgi:hypothetical protein